MMRFASASREFSTNSSTTLAGRSTTSPAAIWLATCSGNNRMRFIAMPRGRSRNGEREAKDRAAVGRVPGKNFALMVLHNFFADGKAEAGAVGFAVGGKGLEQTVD